MPEELQNHIAQFENFVTDKISLCQGDSSPMLLKLEHSRRVYAITRELLQELPEHLRRAALLASLYHDLARFDQYLEYGTFKDKDSFDHGLAGSQILRKKKFVAGEADWRMIAAAVRLHNVFALPKALDADLALICHAVRDADKLDILRIMAAHLESGPYNPTVVLSLPDTDTPPTKKVMDVIMSGKVASYSDLRSVNDFRMLLGSWLFDMHFSHSRDLFRQQGYAMRIVAALPQTAQWARGRDFLLGKISGKEH